MGWIKDKVEKYKTDKAYEKAANEQIKKRQKAEYFRSKEQESLRVAKARARIEADAKIAKEKARYTSRPKTQGGSIGMGLFGAAQGATSFLLGGQQQPSPTPHRKPRMTKKRTHKKRKTVAKKSPPRTPQMGYQWGF